MNLSTQDTSLFFRLMWGLQFYVNRRLQILPNVGSAEAYAGLPTADRIQVRDALWKNPDLIDAYVVENPDRLPAGELEIVHKWKGFVSGTFQIFRYLKKHAIFILDDDRVYGVLGLHDSIEDALGGRRPPIMVEAVLLPFKGQIVYDGILQAYNIYFGGGIRSGLNEAYMVARQNDRIVTTLEPQRARAARPTRQAPAQDWGLAVDELVQAADKLKGGPAVQGAAFNLLRASARLVQAAVHDPDDLDALWDLERKARTALSRLQTVLSRAER